MSQKGRSGTESKRRGGKQLGALAVAGIIGVVVPHAAHADETRVARPAMHASASIAAIARAVIAHLLADSTPASVTAPPSPGTHAPTSCGCMRAGNGKGGPKKIDCNGEEARQGKADGTLSNTCST